ncbi:MAG: hypothetical protein MI757_20070 [Pirellulales bacterium]|nr:hypothetical protein [Pirellulales bacterium]
MSRRKNQRDPQPSRKIGEFLVTEAVHARRKWSKPRSDSKQGHLWESKEELPSGPPASRRESEEERPQATTSDSRGDAAAAASGTSLFQSIGNCCDEQNEPAQETKLENLGEIVTYHTRVRPCNCRKWFCEGCGPKLGKKLRGRLLDRLEQFESVFGVTLTVDPNLFGTAEQAWLYVMQNRLLSRYVRELKRRGRLHSAAYFWVVEFQKGTEFAHWHLLLDASRIEFGELVEVWSRFRPNDAGGLDTKVTAQNYHGQAPAFGSVRFTVRGDSRRAGFYASKYLVKFPKDGFPDWVLDRQGRMPRYGRSRGFFPRTPGHDPICFCEICRGDADPPKKQGKRTTRKKTADTQNKEREELPTIRERVSRCGQSCNVVEVPTIELHDGVVCDGRAVFLKSLDLPYEEVCDRLNVDPGNWEVQLSDGDDELLTTNREDAW